MRQLQFSALSLILRAISAGILVTLLSVAGGCAPASQVETRNQDAGTIHATPTTASIVIAPGSPSPALTAVSQSIAAAPPTAMAGPSSTASSPSPGPTLASGCRQGPCATSLQYAVNGCSCAGQTYEESQVTAQYCCAKGFSNSECPEALQQQALAESLFGKTQEEVESHLVTVRLQGWVAHVHEKAEPAFKQVASKIENMGYQIREPVESYYWREVSGHQVLSFHSFGLAVDINPSANPRCGVTAWCRCNNDLVTDLPPQFVQAFKDAGFEWGGDWSEQPDPMHFEWAGWH